MKALLPWLAKAVFSAVYWFGALYLAMGLFFGDRLTPNGIVGPPVVIPLWLFVIVALGIYALCSAAWNRMTDRLT